MLLFVVIIWNSLNFLVISVISMHGERELEEVF